jgi:lysophospholipase L1-like esterase
MPKIKYIGTADNFSELAYTGKQSVWQVGQGEWRPDAEFSQLMASGYFESEPLPVTATLNLTGGISLSTGPIGTHISSCCIGDSITRRGANPGLINTTSSALGMWNWANWMIGAPFVFRQNLGVAGDTTRSIMTRITQIPSNVQVVFVMTGTNDVLSMSNVATQPTIDSTFTNVSTYIAQGISAITATGKKVVISTVIPNSAYSSAADSRIQLLDQLNVFIGGLASSSVFVIDGFTAMWDSAQPTLRLPRANTMNADGTHPAGTGAYSIGKAAMATCKALVQSCIPDYDLYDNFSPMRQLYSGFRSGTGGEASTKTAGTGTLADGWRSINGSGTPTFTLSNAVPYSLSTDFVGPFTLAPKGVDEYWQEINVTNAIAGDGVRIMFPSSSSITNLTSFPDVVFGGGLYFAEIDVWVKSATNLSQVVLSAFNNFTVGTSPSDQSYVGTTQLAVKAGTVDDNASTIYAIPEGYRVVLRTPVLRAPENINITVAQTLNMYFDLVFNGAGSAVIWLGRPRIWGKTQEFTS